MNSHDAHNNPSFSLKNRLARVLWNAVDVLLVRYSPRPFHAWRIFWLRIFGAKVGKKVHYYPRVSTWAPWNIELHDCCAIANNVRLYSQGKITVGRRAVVSQGSHLCAGTHDYSDPGFPLLTRPIHIGDYAWIAAEVFIHPGVRIGEGAVVGARSVVGQDMTAWYICSGFPCKQIKPRIPESEIESFRNSLNPNA